MPSANRDNFPIISGKSSRRSKSAKLLSIVANHGMPECIVLARNLSF